MPFCTIKRSFGKLFTIEISEDGFERTNQLKPSSELPTAVHSSSLKRIGIAMTANTF